MITYRDKVVGGIRPSDLALYVTPFLAMTANIDIAELKMVLVVTVG